MVIGIIGRNGVSYGFTSGGEAALRDTDRWVLP